VKFKKFIFLILAFVLLQNWVYSIDSGVAIEYDTEIIYSLKDAHIYNYYPNNNYGDWEEMYCGNWVGTTSPLLRQNIVYIYFDLYLMPENWTDVGLSLRVRDIPKPFDLNMGIVNDYWNEYTITWNNRPNDIIWAVKSLDFTTDGIYLFDVGDLISSSDLEFSIILYDQHTEDEVNVLITAWEYYINEYCPQLIFTYPVEPDEIVQGTSPSVPSFSLLLIGIILVFSMMLWVSQACM